MTGTSSAREYVERHRSWTNERVQVAVVVVLLYVLASLALHAAGHNLRWNLLGGGDGLNAGLPSKIFAAKLSPWNPYVQLGQPTFPNTQFQAFYPPGLVLMAVFPNTFGYNLFILTHYVLAGCFFFLFARNLDLHRYAAFFGGLAFLSSGFLLAHKGHQAMLSTAIWLPLVLFFCDRFVTRNEFRQAVYAGAAFAMCLLAGFPQIAVYSLLVIVPYTVFRSTVAATGTMAMRIGKAFAGLAVLGVFAALASSLELAAVAEMLPYVTRQKITLEMFSQDFLPAYHLLALLIPNLLGGFHGVPSYSQNMRVVELYPYVGLFPLAFALVGIYRIRSAVREVWFWTAMVAAATVLSLGFAPLQRALYLVPVYNLFRAPARHLFELNFGICVLATYGVNRLLSAKPRIAVRAIRWASLVLTAVFVITVAGTQLLRELASLLSEPAWAALNDLQIVPQFGLATVRQLILANLYYRHPTILYPLVVLCFTIGLLLVWRRLPAHFAVGLAAAFLIVDVYSVYHTLYANPDTRELYAGPQKRPEVAFLDQQQFDKAHYRVYPVDPPVLHTYPLLNMMYGLSVINDYTPMWLSRYQSMTGFDLNGAAPAELLAQPRLLAALSVQYIFAREPIDITRVRNTTAADEVPAAHVPIPPLNCAALQCVLASFPDSATIRLQSSDGTAVSIVHVPVTLSSNSLYKISFDARSEGEPDKPLIADLYSVEPGRPPYDNAEQEVVYRPAKSAFVRYTAIVNTGASAPPSAYVRLYTQSQTPVLVRNVSVGTVALAPPPAYTEVARTQDGLAIFKNPSAVRRFRFATELVPSTDPADVPVRIGHDSHSDVNRQALVEGIDSPMTVSSGRIISEDLGNNHMEWTVETGPKSFFVVGDSWYPGWTARVDGRETRIYVVNGCVRGVFVEGAGAHAVTMDFWPRSLTLGLIGTALAVLTVAGLVFV